jgi:hypothetical protein
LIASKVDLCSGGQQCSNDSADIREKIGGPIVSLVRRSLVRRETEPATKQVLVSSISSRLS